MNETLVEFFTAHKSVFLTAHILGVVVGMGGATITDILFFHFLRDFVISKKEAEVMHIVSNVILAALIVFYLSGMAIFSTDPATYLRSSPFIAKMLIVLILTVNGVLMHHFIAPHMVEFSFLRHPIHMHRRMHRMRALAFAMGAVSFTSWYATFFIAMLKSYVPAAATVAHIMAAYACVVLAAVGASQVMHFHIHRKSAI